MATRTTVEGQGAEGQGSPYAALEVYKAHPEKYNLVAPVPAVQMRLGNFFSASVEMVEIDSDPTHKEIFKVGSRLVGDRWQPEFMLAQPALSRLGNMAGISYATHRMDDRNHVDIVEFQAMAVMRKPDGGTLLATRTYALDLRDIETEVTRAQHGKVDAAVAEGRLKFASGEFRKKAEHRGPSPWISEDEIIKEKTARVLAEMSMWRRHKVSRCETGAILRAFRGLLAVKSSYTQEELKKPFAVFRIDFKPPMDDPAVKAALISRGLDAQAALYPGREVVQPVVQPLPAPASGVLAPKAEEISEGAEDGGPEPAEEVGSDTSEVDTQTAPPVHTYEQLAKMSVQEHLALMASLGDRKGLGKPKVNVSSLEASARISIILQLQDLPDKEKEEEDAGGGPVSLGEVFGGGEQ